MGRIVKVRVVPNAKKNLVKEFGEGLKVYVTAPPVEGKANKALLEVLAGHFRLKKSQLSITKGHASKDKFVAIN